jgi:hypothetical protein
MAAQLAAAQEWFNSTESYLNTLNLVELITAPSQDVLERFAYHKHCCVLKTRYIQGKWNCECFAEYGCHHAICVPGGHVFTCCPRESNISISQSPLCPSLTQHSVMTLFDVNAIL